MTNYVSDSANDAALDYVADNAAELHICSGDPADRAAAIAASLGSVSIEAADFTKANGDVSGRKHTLAAQNIAEASASGTGAVACIISATELLRKNDLAEPQAITEGNPIAVAAYAHELRDPA